jgi:hypothetical protein
MTRGARKGGDDTQTESEGGEAVISRAGFIYRLGFLVLRAASSASSAQRPTPTNKAIRARDDVLELLQCRNCRSLQ